MRAIKVVGVIGAFVLPVAVQAQTAPPAEANQPSAVSTDQAQPQVATVGQPGQSPALQPRTNHGPLAGVGQSLADMGILVRAQLVDEFAANPVGGVKQGNANVGQFQAGLDLDLDKIMGLQGGTFRFTVFRDYGESLAQLDTGTFTKQQEVFKNQFHLWRLGLISYDQKLFNDKVDVLVGRLGMTALYGRLDNSCYFQSGVSCGVPQILNSAAGFTFATSATWGGNVRFNIRPDIYFQTGAFEVDPFIQHTGGFNFSTTHATGVTIPMEFGFGKFDLTEYRYPSTIKLGGYVSTAPFNNPFFNTKGEPIGLFGGKPVPAGDLRSGVYMMGEKTVWRPSMDSVRSLSLFGGWVLPAENEEVMRAQAYGGAVLRAPFASRPHDAISFEVNYYRLSNLERAFLDDARIRAGGTGDNNPNEVYLEADYTAQVVPGIMLEPNVQYIINPDNSAIPKINFVPKNAVVLGVKLQVNLPKLLGMPSAGIQAS